MLSGCRKGRHVGRGGYLWIVRDCILLEYYMRNLAGKLEGQVKTLPLRESGQVRSANKIKISLKGLPKDFFHPQFQQHFIKTRHTRCRTHNDCNQFQETSYFQQPSTLEPKREGREYKSEQRTRTSKKAITPPQLNKITIDPLNCTFFNSPTPRQRVEQKGEQNSWSDRVSRKEEKGEEKGQRSVWTRLDDVNSLLRVREGKCELSFQRLRGRKGGPLPLIRLSKRTAN